MKKNILLYFALISILITLSSCSLITKDNSNNSVLQTNEATYLFYEIYDHSDVLYDTIATNNASDASKSILLEKFFHSFANNSYSKTEASDTSVVEASSKNNDLFSLRVNAFTSDTDYETYTMNIDFSREFFQITKNNSILTYPTRSFEELLTSGLLEYFFPKKKLPNIQLMYKNNILDTQVDAIWNHHVYSTYYTKEIIKDDFITTPDSNIHIIQSSDSPLALILDDTVQERDIPTAQYKLFNTSHELIIEEPLVFKDNRAEITLPKINDTYQLIIDYKWDPKTNQDYGQITQTAILDVQVPTTYTLTNTRYEPGDLVVIKAENMNMKSNYSFETDIYHEKLQWVYQDNGSYLFLPLTSTIGSGEYTFNIHEETEKKEIVTTQLVVSILPKEFPKQYLKTSSSTASIRSDENQIALSEAFARGRQVTYDEPLWTGPFLQPVGGRISTEYGMIRYTNDSVESSRHNGIDFANPSGTPVLATESGYVRLSEPIAITGNTIFIDHGIGIFSQYYHLASMDVEVGDFVEKGDIIGTVGSTGFSTGPHLHFSMYNNGVYINPWKFFDAPPY